MFREAAMEKYLQVGELRADREAKAMCAVLNLDFGGSRQVENSARTMAATLAFLLRAHVVREKEKLNPA
jgi:hypothetical protein